MGDFNIDLLKHESHDQTNDFLSIMYSHSLLPNINKPTRITRTSATLIDNIYSSVSCNTDTDVSGILITDITDHYPIFHINNKHTSQKPNSISKRVFSQRNIQNFTSCIQATDWTPAYSTDSPQLSFSYIYDKIIAHFRSSFPFVTFKSGYRSKKPWLTEGLKNSIAKKNCKTVSVKLYCKQGIISGGGIQIMIE